MPNIIKIVTGNAHPIMAKEIADHLGLPLSAAEVRKFSDGEIYVEMKENVRGADVFIIQPICSPVQKNLVELLIILDAFKRASAERITAVLPYSDGTGADGGCTPSGLSTKDYSGSPVLWICPPG